MIGLMLLLVLLAGCGSIPNEPELQPEPELQSPFLALPEAFQGNALVRVESAQLDNTVFGKYYGTPEGAQTFEYDGGYIKGYLLKYASPLDARLQHRNAMAYFQHESVQRSSTHNTHFFWQERLPHMFFYVDSCAVYFTLDATQEGFTYDPEYHNQILLVEEKCKEFNRQIRSTNPSNTPFYVELFYDWRDMQPAFDTRLQPGSVVPFETTIRYALAEPESGQIVIRKSESHSTQVVTKTIPIQKGVGSFVFVDTLRPSSTDPGETHTVSISARLEPSYVGTERPDIIRQLSSVVSLPDGQARTTAFDSVAFVVQH